MYSECDVIGMIESDLLQNVDPKDKANLKILVRPRMGNLDLTQVLESKYFFC